MARTKTTTRMHSTAVKKQKCDDSKRTNPDDTFNEPMPNFSVADFYDTKLVEVRFLCKVSEIEQVFKVPRRLLRAHSEYFNAAFKDENGRQFEESAEGVIYVTGHRCWTFCCFVKWMLTSWLAYEAPVVPQTESGVGEAGALGDGGNIANAGEEKEEVEDEDLAFLEDLPPGNKYVHASTTTTGKALQSVKSEEKHATGLLACDCFRASHPKDPVDPVSWNWSSLIRLYIFADFIGCRPLRHRVLEICQTKYYSMPARADAIPPLNTAPGWSITSHLTTVCALSLPISTLRASATLGAAYVPSTGEI